MATQVFVYDKSGNAIGDLMAPLVFRSWVLNEYGKAYLTIAKTSDKCTERLLRFGNYVVIKHDTAGDWAGIVWTPRNWSTDTVEVVAYGPEYLLKLRRGDGPTIKKLTGTAGNIYSQILDDANAEAEYKIFDGDIWEGGVSREESIRYDNLYDTVQRVSSRSGNDWGIDYEIDSFNRLRFKASWYSQRGKLQTLRLEEGVNLKEPQGVVLSEQGDIINDLVVYGNAAVSGGAVFAPGTDPASIGKYGLAQGAVSEQINTQATVDASCAAQLSFYKEPRRVYRNLVALNVNSTFQALGLGDILPLRLLRYGFTGDAISTDTYVRVLAKEFEDTRGEMVLTATEVS